MSGDSLVYLLIVGDSQKEDNFGVKVAGSGGEEGNYKSF